MEEKQQQSTRNIKLKLEQPAIMCSGRERVTCYYRGKIVRESENYYKVITFKSHGEEVQVSFYGPRCITEGWEDLKIIK